MPLRFPHELRLWRAGRKKEKGERYEEYPSMEMPEEFPTT